MCTSRWSGAARGPVNSPGNDEIPGPLGLAGKPSAPHHPRARHRLLQIRPRPAPVVPAIDVPLRECPHGRTRVPVRPRRRLCVVLRAIPRRRAGADRRVTDALRYSAFAIGDAGYLLRTWHPSRRPRTLNLDPALRWTRLAVLETRRRALRRHRHRAVPCHVHPAGAAWRPRGDEQVRPARQALDLPWSHWLKGAFLPRHHPEGAVLEPQGNGSIPADSVLWRGREYIWR